jgi:hypothetical protein
VDAKQEPINKDAVASYINGARDALQSAQYGLDGDFDDVVINIEKCETCLNTKGYL